MVVNVLVIMVQEFIQLDILIFTLFVILSGLWCRSKWRSNV